MTPTQFQHRILLPATDAFPYQDNPQSRALLFAIAGQESGWAHRLQEGGPARGFWQFELGGVNGVFENPRAASTLLQFCQDWAIEFTAEAIYEAIAFCDPLAYTCARLALWLDPAPLPAVGAAAAAWSYYVRVWRPGHPRPTDWAANYALALNPPAFEA